MRSVTASLGFLSVGLFGAAFVVFAFLNPEFDLIKDYVSKLGARGEPYALWWNLIGFFTVGLLLSAFGFSYGRVLQDKWVGAMLSLFGVGFCVAAFPADMEGAGSMSGFHTIHFVAVCIGLGAWMIGLARMASLPSLGKAVHRTANIAAVLVVIPIVGAFLRLWSMPVAHRLVFAVVFGWIIVTSWRLHRGNGID